MNRVKKYTVLLWCLITLAAGASAEIRAAIAGSVEWDKMELRASAILDLGAADIRIPAGRVQGEEILRDEYPRLIRPWLLALPVDSSSTLGDLVGRGEFSLSRTDALSAAARSVPAALSPDFKTLSAGYTVDITQLSAALIRHRYAGEVPRVLLPIPTAAYTGIIILAYEELPVHGRNVSALPIPCVFPKIWDTEMNLIYERNMMDPQIAAKNPLVRYVSPDSVFRSTPSGLDPALAELVGETPLRIIARGVFGIRPTDPIIDRDDALLILSSEANRRLLREGKVAIVINNGTLVNKF